MAKFGKGIAKPRRAQPDFAREFLDYYRQQTGSTTRVVEQKGALRHLEVRYA